MPIYAFYPMLLTIVNSIQNLAELHPVLALILLTILPVTELRASIPFGILVLDMHWLSVFAIAVITNALLGFFLYLVIDKLIWIVTSIPVIDKWYDRYIERKQHKIKPHVDKYGFLGLALFIGIPLPGSGVFTGAVVGYLLGLETKTFMKAVVVGVCAAAVIVTIATLTGVGAMQLFTKGV